MMLTTLALAAVLASLIAEPYRRLTERRARRSGR